MCSFIFSISNRGSFHNCSLILIPSCSTLEKIIHLWLKFFSKLKKRKMFGLADMPSSLRNEVPTELAV